MTWGTELWDRCDSVFAYTENGIDSLENDFSEYVKERSAIELEYANRLKKLSDDYSEKLSSEDGRATKSRNRGLGRKKREKEEPKKEVQFAYNMIGEYQGFFKRMLTELLCVASQHEEFSHSLINETHTSIKEQVKKYKEIHRSKKVEHIQHSSELDVAYPPMEKAREKFKKAFQEKDKAIDAYENFNGGGTNRKELHKLNQQVQVKTSNYDSTKGEYANQMLLVNDARSKFYGQLQPDILNKLQFLEEDRIAFLKQTIKGIISKQREVSVSITNQCNSLEESFKSIQPEFVTSLFLEITKSGDVPPCEFNFENMNNGEALVMQDVVEESKASNLNLYPKKRIIELQISKVEADLTKKREILEELQKEKQSDQEDADNGETKRTTNIYEIAAKTDAEMTDIQELETGLVSLKQELFEIDNQLFSLRSNRPYPGSVAYQEDYEEWITEDDLGSDEMESNDKYQISERSENSKLQQDNSMCRQSTIDPKVLERLKTLDFDNIPPPDI